MSCTKNLCLTLEEKKEEHFLRTLDNYLLRLAEMMYIDRIYIIDTYAETTAPNGLDLQHKGEKFSSFLLLFSRFNFKP